MPMPRPNSTPPVALALAAMIVLAGDPAQAAPTGAARTLTVSAVPAASTDGRRIALVIGNAAYKDAPLSNPGNDARAMAKALEAAGFTVTLRLDANQQQLVAAVRDFGDELRRGAVGLFYFAGHGMQIKGRNYLIPVGANIEREDEVAYASLDAQAVLDKMESAGNGTNVMILDACRNNPFARSFRSAAQGLAQMDAPVGTLVAFSTAPGSVASDGSGSNGLYTQHLLSAMRQPGAKLEDVFKQARAAVRRDSKGKQVPWESTSLEGDFYFHRPVAAVAPTAAAPVPAAAAPAADVEQWLWEAVQKQPDALGLRAYLQRFPQGRHVAEARAQLQVLETTAPPVLVEPASRLDPADKLWAAVQKQPDALNLRAYLQRFPHGRHVAEARALLQALEAAAPAPQPNLVNTMANAPVDGAQAATSGMTNEAEYRLQLQGGRANSAWASTPVVEPEGAGDGALLAAPSGRVNSGWALPAPASPAATAPARSAGGFGIGDSWTYGVRDQMLGSRVVGLREFRVDRVEDGADAPVGAANGQQLDAHGRVQQVAADGRRGQLTYSPFLPGWWPHASPNEKRDFEFEEVETFADGRKQRTRFRATVSFVGVESIEVPAGRFEAQRFDAVAYVLRRDGSTTSAYRRLRHWVAFEVGREVAIEEWAYDPGQRHSGGELQWRLRSELASMTRASGPLAANR